MPSTKAVQSEVDVSTMTWFTLQASWLAFWEASKPGGEIKCYLPGTGAPLTHPGLLAVTLSHTPSFLELE